MNKMIEELNICFEQLNMAFHCPEATEHFEFVNF